MKKQKKPSDEERFAIKEEQEENLPIIGLVIREEEQEGLQALCKQYDVKVDASLFYGGLRHYLWGFAIEENGSLHLGLVGTSIMMHLEKILHGLDEFETFLVLLKESKQCE